jgi:hypothetical protein
VTVTTSISTATAHRTVAWTKDDPIGAEFANIELAPDRMRASGVAIGSDPEPYRLDYELDTSSAFVTARLVVRTCGDGWSRELALERGASGRWNAGVSQNGHVALPDAGGELDGFDSALDPDLGLSPLFNSMPVLRHRIHDGGGARDFLMVWISVPDLSIHPSPQRYTFAGPRADGGRIIRFEAVGEGDEFAAEVIFDADGLVIDYPGIASRIRAGRES